ncbi:unnamed protein product [Mytilus edulis]|uniref:Uncharacterized protein n=1 Tax=Mytilus edulis TaxID=6550 RepID=A0A8S3TV17_MYTED|nr:unnamed protein product [Mytilus edulis]
MDAWWERESLVKFESPTSIFIAAPSGTGKTVLTKKILEHADGMFKVPPSRIFFCYSMWQKLYTEMKDEIKNIQFYQGLPTMEDLSEWGAEEGHKILVLDDLMITGADSEELVHMMCVGSHHSNFTVIFLLQNIFHKSKSLRTASLNCHYFILMGSKRDPLQIQTLGRQMFPGKTKYFMDAYQKATATSYGFLLVDINPHSDKTYQLRTNILPGQDTIVYQPSK